MSDVNIDKTMLNNIATQNPSTLNPSFIIFEVTRMMVALITNRNNPRVTIVIGNVRNIKMGFTYTFIKTNNTETTMAMGKLFTSTPGIRLAITKTAKAVEAILIKKFISAKAKLWNYSECLLMFHHGFVEKISSLHSTISFLNSPLYN